MNSAIEVKKLNFRIKERKILENINLKISPKSFTGILGPNGSGKTTLVRHFYRALSPKYNTVFIDGNDIRKFSFNESAKKISVMKQENSGDFIFTVLDMVLLGRSPHLSFCSSYGESDVKLAEEALVRVGMKGYVKSDFSVLSGGEKQRVLIARSLVQDTEILILDEPTNHLDIYYQWLLMSKISELNKTIVSVFHDINLACEFCDWIYILKNGFVEAEGKPQDIITEKNLKEIFRIDTDIIYRSGKPYVIYRKIKS